MTTPKVGDRVRITREGTVTTVAGPWGGAGNSHVWLDDDAINGVNIAASGTKVEILAPPEPAYALGEAYKSAAGYTYIRVHRGWIGTSGRTEADSFPTRPMRRLIPEKS